MADLCSPFPVMAALLSGGKEFRLSSVDELPSGASPSEFGSFKLTSTSEFCGLTEKLTHEGT